jgi:hypothetical protein
LSSDLGTDIPELGDQTAVVRRFKKFFTELDEDFMPPVTRIGLGAVLRANVKTRLDCFNFVRQHPEIRKVQLKPMMSITGFPRTGSTLLQNLLASVNSARSLRLWELGLAASSFPPPTRRGQAVNDPRVEVCANNLLRSNKFFVGFWDNIWQSHYMAPLTFEEDTYLLFANGILPVHCPITTLGEEYQKDMFHGDATDAYRYMKLFYQTMQYCYAPESHWVTKSPFHALYLKEMFQEIPGMQVVFTHRNPIATIPSYAALVEAFIGLYFPEGELDRRVCGQYTLLMTRLMIHRITEFQKTADPKSYINIKYNEVIKEPVATVRKIHDHFNLSFTAEDASAVETYLADNPQGKHGRKKYTLVDFGFTEEELVKEFNPYVEQFC